MNKKQDNDDIDEKKYTIQKSIKQHKNSPNSPDINPSWIPNPEDIQKTIAKLGERMKPMAESAARFYGNFLTYITENVKFSKTQESSEDKIESILKQDKSSSQKDQRTYKQSKKNFEIEQKHNVKKIKLTETLDTVAFIKPIGQITNNSYEKVFDCCCFFIHCQIHKKCLVSKTEQYFWLPFIIIPENCCWTEMAKKCVLEVLSHNKYDCSNNKLPYQYMQIIDINRIQTSLLNRFAQRFVYYVSISHNESISTQNKGINSKCCIDTQNLVWLELKSIQEGSIQNIWGEELVRFCSLVQNYESTTLQALTKVKPPESTSQPQIQLDENSEEICLPQMINEFGLDQVFHFSPKNNEPKNTEENMLKLLKITENDIERLYNDYVEHCYPSFKMTVYSFRQYMVKNGFDSDDFSLHRLFNAFNYNLNNFITFQEFLLGFVCLESETAHNEVRIKFIFRYYDTKKIGGLFKSDLQILAFDILRNMSENPYRIKEKDVKKKFEEIKNLLEPCIIRKKQVVIFNNFFDAIIKRKLRGTSGLLRTGKRSIFSLITKRLTARNVKQQQQQQQQQKLQKQQACQKLRFSSVLVSKYYPEICQGCKTKHYTLLPYVLVFNSDGYNDYIEKIDSAKLNRTAVMTELHIKEYRYLQSEHPARILMLKIRNFNRNKKNAGFMTSKRESEIFYDMFKKIYDDIIPILTKENRVYPVSSPCFVIGDIHGNLEDLMSLEMTIWRRFPCTGINYLFLGDFVDRGRWSVECIVYLLSMKVLMPNSIILIRGNHEIRKMQKKYTYKNECLDKYEDEMGEQIWDLTNEIFDRLPMCAVVDNEIFCAHGGIPMTNIKLDEFERIIPTILPDPQNECIVAWEMLWSDPANFEKFKSLVALAEGYKDNYLPNTKRGTGCFFNEKAAKIFLNENKLSHIIRAHEVPKEGFKLNFNNLCNTIFSSSHYCGNDNKCAVQFIDQRKMRIIRIDTTLNQPATDF